MLRPDVQLQLSGRVTEDHIAVQGRSDVARLHTPRVRWGAHPVRDEAELIAFEHRNVVVSRAYAPILVDEGLLLINQTYPGVGDWFRLRAEIVGDRFTSDHPAIPLDEPHVVIGGPIDGVWYHWLINWAPRLLVFKRLRPDLFADPSVRFLIDQRAEVEPFRSVITALGVDLDRVTFSDHDRDYLLERALIVSFLNDHYIYREIIREARDTIRAALGVVEPAKPRRRLFLSRQSFQEAKRRIANFPELLPLLQAFGFEVVDLAQASLEEQVRWFAEARVVLGAHGSDFTDLIFAGPGATALVLETQRNLRSGIGQTLAELAHVAGATYRPLLVEEEIRPEVDYESWRNVHNRDLIVDPRVLRWVLQSLDWPKTGP